MSYIYKKNSLFVESISLRLHFNTWFLLCCVWGVCLFIGVVEVFFEFIEKKLLFFYAVFSSVSVHQVTKLVIYSFCFIFSRAWPYNDHIFIAHMSGQNDYGSDSDNRRPSPPKVRSLRTHRKTPGLENGWFLVLVGSSSSARGSKLCFVIDKVVAQPRYIRS